MCSNTPQLTPLEQKQNSPLVTRNRNKLFKFNRVGRTQIFDRISQYNENVTLTPKQI